MVVRGVSESAASQLAATIARTLSGPVEALSTVNQPELSAGRIDLVADAFRHGFTEYPQVARFFLWHRLSDAIAPNEVIFFDRGADARRPTATGGSEPSALTSFARDAAIGPVLYREALARMALPDPAQISRSKSKEAARSAGITRPATCQTLRHSFASTHVRPPDASRARSGAESATSSNDPVVVFQADA
jgi:hypothetical protein